MTLADDLKGFSSRFIDCGPVTLHAIEGGPVDGPLVILLHGFPEMHLAWRHQLQPLVRAGFRVLAPDLRGYARSDKPKGVAHYTMGAIGDDVIALMRACGRERAHLVAHDWGGTVAWTLAQSRPQHVETLTILNSPHPRVFIGRLRGIEQWAASWYMLLFQVPGFERVLARNNFATLVDILRRGPRTRGAYDDEDVAAYTQAWREPGALVAMLSWYRAMGLALRRGPRKTSAGPLDARGTIAAPTLVFWGMDDDALPPGNLDGLEHHVQDLRVVRLPNCSHWVMRDAPRIVAEQLIAFLRASSSSASSSPASSSSASSSSPLPSSSAA